MVWVASFPSFHDPRPEPAHLLTPTVSAGQAGWHRAGGASPAGGDGFSEAIQVVEVVMCGEELAAGGTDGGRLQGPTNHP